MAIAMVVVTLLEILMHCWYCSFNGLRPLQQSRVDGARSPRSQLFKMLFTSHSSSTKSSDTDTEIEDRGTFDVLSGGVWEGISILGQETKFCCILFCICNCGDSTENVCLNFDPNPPNFGFVIVIVNPNMKADSDGSRYDIDRGSGEVGRLDGREEVWGEPGDVILLSSQHCTAGSCLTRDPHKLCFRF